MAEATGSGSQRLYGFCDLVAIKIIKGLLDTGIGFQNVRNSLVQLDQIDATELPGSNLFSDRKRVVKQVGTDVFDCGGSVDIPSAQSSSLSLNPAASGSYPSGNLVSLS